MKKASEKKHKFVVDWRYRMGLYGPGYMPTGLCKVCGGTYLEPIHQLSKYGEKLNIPKITHKTAVYEEPSIKVIFKMFNYELWVIKRKK